MGQRRVQVLPDAVANRIAAGEVVERPASVVKELVENAIDAGATRVRVRVEAAGRELVAVEDDGEGMTAEDALLALERHATSKVTCAEDLEHIGTLGFRGEALPSIASVSRCRLLTRVADAAEGVEIRVEGGSVSSVGETGAPRGTVVEVADLFFNVPARRKFLKSDATELRVVVELVTHLALVHPTVGFELKSGPRTLLAVPAEQTREERAAELAGREAAGGLYWAHFGDADRGLAFGFAAPHDGRGHRKGVRTFVNGRPVQDRLLFRAILDGYRGLLEQGRYPVALLWLRVPADEVDVNVHPAKREVRFRDERAIFRWVAAATSEALSGTPWALGRREETVATPGGQRPAGSDVAEVGSDRPSVGRVREALEGYASRWAREARPLFSGEGSPVTYRGVPGGAKPGFGPGPRGAEPSRTPLTEPAGSLSRDGRFGNLRHLGTFDATYLLFEDATTRELILIDQHAAHERILYEALRERPGRSPNAGQPLLLPVTLECAPRELAAYEERRADLEALGFRVEPFGPSSLVIEAAPPGLSPGGAEGAVRDLLGGEEPVSEDAVSRREALARRAACAAAVKARSSLVAAEVEELLRRLEGLDHPTHCPHGRPLLVRLSRQQVEAMFHRR